MNWSPFFFFASECDVLLLLSLVNGDDPRGISAYGDRFMEGFIVLIGSWFLFFFFLSFFIFPLVEKCHELLHIISGGIRPLPPRPRRPEIAAHPIASAFALRPPDPHLRFVRSTRFGRDARPVGPAASRARSLAACWCLRSPWLAGLHVR